MLSKTEFYESIITATLIFDNYPKTIEKLCNMDLNSAGYHQITRKDDLSICSIKCNDKARLLVFCAHLNHKKVLIIAEELPNHEYEKSWLLKMHNPELSTILKKVISEYGNIEELSIERPSDVKKSISKVKGTFIPAYYQNNKWIELSIHQNRILQTLQMYGQMPLFLQGPAGSGKTLLSFMKLIELAIKQEHETETLSILFTTKSENLAKTINNIWQTYRAAEERDMHEVKILFFDQLCQKDANVAQESFVDIDAFLSWFKKETRTLLHQWKAKNQEKSSSAEQSFNQHKKDPDRIYQELRILSGYDKKSYKKQDKATLFPVKDRGLIVFLYKKFLKYLENSKKIDASFFKFKGCQLFDYIIVDEAPDLSNGQLQELMKLAINEQILFCGDPNQSLTDYIYQLPYILQTLFKDPSRISYLHESFRCKPAINQAGFAWEKAKCIAVGLKAPVIEQSTEELDGEAVWLNLSNEKIQGLGLPEDLCIIIFDIKESKDAKKLFKSEQVFLIEEFKGLEDETVIVFNPLKNMGKLNSLFDGKEKENKGIKNPRLENILPFNKGYCATTRASKTLIVIQKDDKATRSIRKFLQQEGKFSKTLKNPILATITKNNWEKRVAELLEADAVSQAIGLAKKWLQNDKNSINKWVLEKIISILQDKTRKDTQKKKMAEMLFVQGLEKDIQKNRKEFDKLLGRYLLGNLTINCDSLLPTPKPTVNSEKLATINQCSNVKRSNFSRPLKKVKEIASLNKTQINSIESNNLTSQNPDDFIKDLKDFYNNLWPNSTLKKVYQQYSKNADFLSALEDFSRFIDSKEGKHKDRYQKFNKSGISYTYETENFKSLKREIAGFLPYNRLSLVQFLLKFPLQSFFIFFIFFVAVFFFGMFAARFRNSELDEFVNTLELKGFPLEDITNLQETHPITTESFNNRIVEHYQENANRFARIQIFSSDLQKSDASFGCNPTFVPFNLKILEALDFEDVTRPGFFIQKRVGFFKREYFTLNIQPNKIKKASEIPLNQLNSFFEKNPALKAKLAVIQTLIPLASSKNFGFDDQGNLFIIAVQCRVRANNLADALDRSWAHAADSLKDWVELPSLRIDDIKEMIELYKPMLFKKISSTHPGLYGSEQFMQTLIRSYIKACEDLLTEIRVSIVDDGVREFNINSLLHKHIRNLKSSFIYAEDLEEGNQLRHTGSSAHL